MDILEAIQARKSIRKFTSEPVPKDVLRNILASATRAPSAMNTQPWEFIVIAGDVLEAVKKKNVEKLRAGSPLNPEHLVVGWPQDGMYRRRQVELGKQIFQLMNIPREDKVQRAEWLERGFRYFDAPAAIIVLADRVLSEGGPLLDIGTALQTICLAALHYGLGTCIEDQGVMYPEVLREYAGVPASKRIIMSVAIGYPDGDFPANRLRSSRESVDAITSWRGM